jgi:hypothetical protein
VLCWFRLEKVGILDEIFGCFVLSDSDIEQTRRHTKNEKVQAFVWQELID